MPPFPAARGTGRIDRCDHGAAKGGGQILIGIAGRGWYQEEGKNAVEILPGTIIHIPANVKHGTEQQPTVGLLI